MPSIIGKLLLGIGAVIAATGGLLLVAGRWLEGGGRLLPGDILWRRGGVSVYVPLGTCIVVSVVASLLLTLTLHILGHWRQ